MSVSKSCARSRGMRLPAARAWLTSGIWDAIVTLDQEERSMLVVYADEELTG